VPERGQRNMAERAQKEDREKQPDVSVVIVSWNARQALERCLDSLFARHPQLGLDVVVVDNQSDDGTAAMVRQRYPGIGLIENFGNLGFAAACNHGLNVIDQNSPYVLVLNPDIYFTQDVLGPLIEFLGREVEAHVVTPRILNPDGSLQRTCRRRDPTVLSLLCSLGGRADFSLPFRRIPSYTYDDLPPDETHEIEAASGSFLLMKRMVLVDTGGFDDRYYMYAEDLDWCLTARRIGFRIFFFPQVSVYHDKGTSSRQRPVRALWHMHCTAVQYVAKNRRQDYVLPARLAIYAALWLLFALRLPSILFKKNTD